MNLQTWNKQEEFERHLHLRYVFTSLKCGQVPVDFLKLPYGEFHKCRDCRERDIRARAGDGMADRFFDEWDLSDEE